MTDAQKADEALPSQHYVFAHWVLPQVAHERGAWLLSVLAGHDGARLLGDLWHRAGAEMPAAQQRSAEGLRHEMSSLPGGRVVAVIALPPPSETTEAHLIAVFAKLMDKTDPSYDKLGDIRVFSLDREDDDASGEPVTVLGEWTAERERLDLGPGPEVEPATFVQACLQRFASEPAQAPH
jgi:hypothetical protein